MQLVDITKKQEQGNWGYVFEPELGGWDVTCKITDCKMVPIFEFYPWDEAYWYGLCALHGWVLGMHSYQEGDLR